MGASYVDPKFDDFANLLIQEEAKLMNMGLIKSSKPQALVANESKVQKESDNLDKKQKKKKNKPHKESESSSSKGETSKKEKPFCAYCKKDGHEEHYCYKKDIDELKNLLKKNHIDFPSRMSESSSPSTSK